MSAPAQLKCDGRVCPQCGKCRDWDPNKSYKRRDDATCRDNTKTLDLALCCAASAVHSAPRARRIASYTSRDNATNRCRKAADDLEAAFNDAILGDRLLEAVADALSRIQIIVYDVDRASDEDPAAIMRALSAVRRAHREHVCHCG